MRLLRLCRSGAGLGRVDLTLAASGQAPVYFIRHADEFEMSAAPPLPARVTAVRGVSLTAVPGLKKLPEDRNCLLVDASLVVKTLRTASF
jgi:hypothetical protein